MIRRVHADPPLIWRLYEPESPDLYLHEIGADRTPGPIARLFGARRAAMPEPLPNFVYDEGTRLEVDLDKSWDGINFCLKKLSPADNPSLFEDGQPVGNIDVGYGPAMTFDAALVRRLAETYAGVTTAEVLKALDPSAMSDVYPNGLWSSTDADLGGYLSANFEALKDYLQSAAAQELGIVIVYV